MLIEGPQYWSIIYTKRIKEAMNEQQVSNSSQSKGNCPLYSPFESRVLTDTSKIFNFTGDVDMQNNIEKETNVKPFENYCLIN